MSIKNVSLLSNMLKRAAESESDEGPAAKQAAGGAKGSAAGMRADQVTNPIPRLFKQNSITIHISQRTFEEVGPGELKWFPVCQYWAAMFDQFHKNQWNNYIEHCCTFTISDPKVRISNILMLQDEQKTESGTPRDVSIFTQACYLMLITPTRQNNWFRLGNTDDNMDSQKYLEYKPFAYSDGKIISQLVNMDNYTDFERLVINPCKPDIYSGWNPNSMKATKELDIQNDGKEYEENSINPDKDKLDFSKDYHIENAYIYPGSKYYAAFSSSVNPREPAVPMKKHTTYMRNLDKISLFKYGDSIEFNINTNMDGIPLLNANVNFPFPQLHHILTPQATTADTTAYTAPCYPSPNRPFFYRGDNFESIKAIEANKALKPLSHHFLTMPPIKKNDGTLIKQRCSFILEQSVTVTFHFPETTHEDDYQYMNAQRDGILLRPALIKLKRFEKDDKRTPTPPPSPKTPPEDIDFSNKKVKDFIRDSARKVIGEKLYMEIPQTPSDLTRSRPSVFGELLEYEEDYLRFKPLARLALVPNIVLPAVQGRCTALRVPMDQASKGLVTEIDFDNLPEHRTQETIMGKKIIPTFGKEWPLNIEPFSQEEIKIILDNYHVGHIFWGYVWINFLDWCKMHKYMYQAASEKHTYEFSDYYYDQKVTDHVRLSKLASQDMRSKCSVYGAAAWLMHKGIDKIYKVYPNKMIVAAWNRDINNPTAFKVAYREPMINKEDAFHFHIGVWQEYLNMLNICPLGPTTSHMIDFLKKYNICVNQEMTQRFPTKWIEDPAKIKLLWDKKLITIKDIEDNVFLKPEVPKPEKQHIEKIFPLTLPWTQYKTTHFFV